MATAADNLESFARAHAARAWNLACALLGNGADADDAVQQAFVVAASRLGDVRGEPWPWFAAVVANQARNLRRKRARHAHEEPVMAQPDGKATDPRLAAEQTEMLARLRMELEALPQDQREALSMTHLAGLSFGQASVALGVPASTLSDRVQSALGRLRARLNAPEPQIVRCLPMLMFPLPSGGLETSIHGWLAGAKSSAALVTGTSIMAGQKLLWAAAVAAVLVLLGWQAPKWLSPATSISNAASAVSAGDAAARHKDGDRGKDYVVSTLRDGIQDSMPRDGAMSASKGEAFKDAIPAKEITDNPAGIGQLPGPGKDPVETAPLPGPGVTTVVGKCHQASRANGVWRLNGDPVAGAAVWIVFEGLENLSEELRARVKALSAEDVTTTSAQDGGFRLINIPRGASFKVYMAHPDYYCALNAPGAMGGFSEDSHWPAFAQPKPAKEDVVAMTRERRNPGDAPYSVQSLRADNDVEEVSLNAERGCWFYGRVSAPGNRTYAGMVVSARSENGRVELEVLTDVDGTYRVGPLRPGNQAQFTVQHLGANRFYGRNTPVPAAAETRYDIELSGGTGVVRARFVAAELHDFSTLRIWAVHDSITRRIKTPDAAGRALFDDLDIDKDWSFTVYDAQGERIADGGRVRPTTEGLDLELREIVPVRWQVSVPASAFTAELDVYCVVFVPVEFMRGSIRDTLSDFLREGMASMSSEAIEARDKYTAGALSRTVPQRFARPTFAVAIPYKFLKGNQFIELSTAQLEQCWISETITPEFGRTYDLPCNRPLRGLQIKGSVNDRREGVVIAGSATTRHVSSCQVGSDGAFELPLLWPGDYIMRWSPDYNSEKGKVHCEVKGVAGEKLSVVIIVND